MQEYHLQLPMFGGMRVQRYPLAPSGQCTLAQQGRANEGLQLEGQHNECFSEVSS